MIHSSKAARRGARSGSRTLLGVGALIGTAALPALASLAPPPATPAAKRPAPAPVKPAGTVQFNRDIRPILSDNCFACHGPDKNKRIAGFRLDVREEALGRGVIIPGKPEQSRLIARVMEKDEARQMPPPSFHKKLSPEQKETLRRWVAEGAKYEAHWAYIPPKRPAVPQLADARYPVRNPVDAFIRAKLLEKGILPSPEADRRTLIRRVYLDLIGVPPTPQDVDAFLADSSPDAYEKVVDRLLASPRYGERMAIPWLDVVRYSDTVGFHGDQNQNSWFYRDWVIDAFNTNKPFDQFTIEQLAGDLLPNPTPEQRAATCFTRLTMMTREGGAQPKEYLAKYTADRVRTVGMAWLGSTLACCECHDHKYDPLTAKDFYSLGAFFADVKQWGVYADYNYTPNPDLKGYNNDFPFPPEIKIASPALKARIARDRDKIAQLALQTETACAADPAEKAAFDAWRQAGAAFLAAHADGWETPVPEAETAAPNAPAAARKRPAAKPKSATKLEAAGETKPAAALRVEPDGRVVLTDRTPANLTLDLAPTAGWLAALRLEAVPSAENGGSVFRPGMEAALLTLSATVHRADGKTEAVSFRHAGANYAEPRYRSSFEIIGVHGGWKLSPAHKTEPHVAVWLPAAPIRLNPGDQVSVTLPNVNVGCVRVSLSPLAPDDPNRPAMAAGLRAALENPTTAEAKAVALRTYLLSTAWNADAFARAKTLEADLLSCRDGITPVMVTEAVQPAVMRVLPRGNWQDESGPVVQPNVPHFLPGYQADPGRRLTRLDLAKWLVSPENPLTARVFVNRLWKQFFGNGLSMQVEDLGAQGEWPTHPELLDWLASEFMQPAASCENDGEKERGRDRATDGPKAPSISLSLARSIVRGRSAHAWDVKHVVRLLVTSATYRQTSSLRPELRESDPNNRLLASQNPRRLEAELVRDNALAVAGLLDPELGGPPAKPYQPAGYYANLQFPDRDYIAERDERQWRRGVYMHWQRTFLHPMLANFDAPSREDCIAARTAANTPQQALTLLNDPTFVEAARAFAASLAAVKSDDAERLELAYERALARPIKEKEKQALLQFLGRMREEYRQRPEDAKRLLTVGIAPAPANADPVELAAWTSVCRVILNLQEVITRY